MGFWLRDAYLGGEVKEVVLVPGKVLKERHFSWFLKDH